MDGVTIETKLERIDVYRDDEPSERKGHVDVKVRLLRSEDDVIAVLSIRVYFTSEDVSVRDLIDSAFQRAHRAVQQIAEQSGSGLPAADPEPLWIE